MRILLNGKIINEEEAVIPVGDHGFLYGMGLFETFRTYGGEPFLLDQHVERLKEGCRILRIAYEPREVDLREQISKLLAANNLEDAYIRLSVSAGSAPLGLPGPSGYAAPNTVMFMKELPDSPSDPAKRMKALIKLTIPRSSPEHAIRLKSFQYMNNIFGKWELADKPEAGNAEGLFLNEKGYVTEGIVSNIFFVRTDGVLATPAIETGCLPGITRSFVMKLASDMGMAVEEGFYKWEDLLQAREVFYTNSIQEIVPIGRLYESDLQSTEINEGKPGNYTVQLIEQYLLKTKQPG